MAITQRYVTANSPGGDGSSGSPWTLAEALANAVAGDVVNVASGSYTLSGNLTATNSGTAASPIVFRGWDGATLGVFDVPARVNKTGALITTGFPSINCQTYTLSGSTNVVFQNLVFSGTASAALANVGTGGFFFNCSAENAGTGANCVGLQCSASGSVIFCDSELTSTGGSTGGCFNIPSNPSTIHGCYAKAGASGRGINAGGTNVVVTDCVVAGCATGIYRGSGTATSLLIVSGCTIQGCETGINTGNTAYTRQMTIVNNLIADCTNYGIDTGYQATGDIPAIVRLNRFRNNGVNIRGLGDWESFASLVSVTSGSADFIAATSGDFRLYQGSAAKEAGFFGKDLGATPHPGVRGRTTFIGGLG